MSTSAERHEFSASEVAELLAELDRRLRRRGVSASVFVVGGAAVAVAGIRGGRLTEDVDVVTDEQVVLEEASLLARERGLPENWLNPNARMWMPLIAVLFLDEQLTLAGALGALLILTAIAGLGRDRESPPPQ